MSRENAECDASGDHQSYLTVSFAGIGQQGTEGGGQEPVAAADQTEQATGQYKTLDRLDNEPIRR